MLSPLLAGGGTAADRDADDDDDDDDCRLPELNENDTFSFILLLCIASKRYLRQTVSTWTTGVRLSHNGPGRRFAVQGFSFSERSSNVLELPDYNFRSGARANSDSNDVLHSNALGIRDAMRNH